MERWFYSGTYMPDGTPITAAAYSAVQEDKYRKRGWVPVNIIKKSATRKPVKKRVAKAK